MDLFYCTKLRAPLGVWALTAFSLLNCDCLSVQAQVSHTSTQQIQIAADVVGKSNVAMQPGSQVVVRWRPKHSPDDIAIVDNAIIVSIDSQNNEVTSKTVTLNVSEHDFQELRSKADKGVFSLQLKGNLPSKSIGREGEIPIVMEGQKKLSK